MNESRTPSPKPTQEEAEGVNTDTEGEEEEGSESQPAGSNSPEPEDETLKQLEQEAQLSKAKKLAERIQQELAADFERQFSIKYIERLESSGILHHFPEAKEQKQKLSRQPQDPKGKRPEHSMADDDGTPGPPAARQPKIPLPNMFSGEGDDLKPDVLGRWFREVKGYLRRYNMTDNTPGIGQWYGDYTTGRAKDAVLALIDEYEEQDEVLPLQVLKDRMTTLFQASTNKDDLWLQWQKVYQTTNGRTARITKVATELEMIRSRLPASSVTPFTQRQRFLDAMDHRLRRAVEPQLRDTDTWIAMVETAERYDATMFKTGAYGRADSGSSRPRNPATLSKNTTKNTPSSKPKAKFGAKKPKASKKPSKAEMDRRKKDGACFYCGEQGHMANDCPKKEIKTNKVTTMDGDSEEEDSEDDEQDEDSEDEEVYVGYILYRQDIDPTHHSKDLSELRQLGHSAPSPGGIHRHQWKPGPSSV